MGWNDRLFEDPYWPEVNQQDDRDSYENWLQYLENQLEETNAELSSQNLTIEDLRRLTGIQSVRKERFNEEEVFDRQNNNQEEVPDQDQEAPSAGT